MATASRSESKHNTFDPLSKRFSKVTPVPGRGHRSKVTRAAWNSSGSYLASSSLDTTTRIWSCDAHGDPREVMALRGHTLSVNDICWSHRNDSQIASASSDKTVRFWDARTGKMSHTLPTSGENISISWSHDGNLVAVGNRDDSVRIIDTRKMAPIRNVKFSCEVNETTFDPHGLLFLTTGYRVGITDEGKVEAMSVGDTLIRERTVLAHTAACYTIDFDRSGRLFATGGADSLACVFDAREMTCIRVFGRLEHPVMTVSMSHDGLMVAMGSEDKVVDIGLVSDGSRVAAIPTADEVTTVAWHPSKHVLAFGCDDKMCRESEKGNVYVMSPPRE